MAFFLISFLESLLPFLFSALKRSWDNLTTAQQQAIINSGTIGQYLKNNLNALSGDLVAAIVKATGLPQSTVESTLVTLAGKLGFAGTAINDAVSFIQKKLQNASSNEEWNGLLQIILSAGATVLSGGSLNWVHLALGLAEWAYQKYIQPLNIPVLNTVVGDAENVATEAQSPSSTPVETGNITKDNEPSTGSIAAIPVNGIGNAPAGNQNPVSNANPVETES